MSKVYIAAPWFTEEQETILAKIKHILEDNDVDYFSPKDANLWKPGDDPLTVLLGNCMAINNCKYVVAVTDGKDVGTIWECGYAFAKGVPVLYIWLGWKPELKFNIMLAASGKVVHTYEELYNQVANYQKYGYFYDVKPAEGMQYE